MALRNYKPTTPSKRHTKKVIFSIAEHIDENLSADKKLELIAKVKKVAAKRRKGLTMNLNYKAGRNHHGRISVRHKGGKVKQIYRVIDFKRDKKDIVGEVVTVEYDPYRSAEIALIKYSDGEYRYILAPNNLKIGNKIISSDKLQDLAVGNSYPLSVIPPATFVHNVELVAGKGGILARSAGTGIQLQGKSTKGYVQMKMPSGEIRLIKEECYATIGFVSNPDHGNEKIGKAGTRRHQGIRPTVRGVAQSYKHPHGGGQGKGGRHGPGGPVKDPWGNKRGVVTRKNKSTNKYIISRRTSKLRPINKPYKTIA